jgi:hypothetical protein
MLLSVMLALYSVKGVERGHLAVLSLCGVHTCHIVDSMHSIYALIFDTSWLCCAFVLCVHTQVGQQVQVKCLEVDPVRGVIKV